jgi:hypothetical protein
MKWKAEVVSLASIFPVSSLHFHYKMTEGLKSSILLAEIPCGMKFDD